MARSYLQQYRQCPSAFYNQRPSDNVDMLVIHNISLPAGQFGTPHVEQLFTGCIDCDAHDSFHDLKGLEVSSHFFIARTGNVTQFVAMDKRAWHAGVSCFEGRDGCNDFSIGIELEGTDVDAYEDAQYESLVSLAAEIINAYPAITLSRIVGHSDIAPGRKTDPGEAFDWHRFKQALLQRLPQLA